MNKKRIGFSVIILILMTTIILMFLLIHTWTSNAKAFDRQLNNPEKLFRGVFTAQLGKDNATSGIMMGDEICIFFDNTNLDNDKIHLPLSGNEKLKRNDFNFYCIKAAGRSLGGENPEKLKTVCYLCKYDGVNSLILLDENNEEIGRISFTIGEVDWLGKRKLNYYWLMEGIATPVHKRGDVPYTVGTSYLKSKYYTGEFTL